MTSSESVLTDDTLQVAEVVTAVESTQNTALFKIIAGVVGVGVTASAVVNGIIRMDSIEGDLGLGERLRYVVTDGCGDEDPVRIRRPGTTGKLLDCASVKPNSIALVNVPGLEPANNKAQPYTADELAAYASSTEKILNDQFDTDTFDVTVMTAPASVSEAVRHDSKSYRAGKECLEAKEGHPSVAAAVLEAMPQTHGYDYVIAIGSSMCTKVIVDANDNKVTRSTDGVAYTSQTEPHLIDVFSHNIMPDSGNNSRLDGNRLKQTIVHEMDHHNRLEHHGNILCREPAYPENVDVYQLLTAASLKRQGCKIYEYGKQDRNIMSNSGLDMSRPITGYTDTQQLDMLRHGSLTASTSTLEDGETTSIRTFGPDETPIKTIRYELNKPISIGSGDEKRRFDQVFMTLRQANHQSRKLTIALASMADGSLRILDTNQFSEMTISNGEVNAVTLGEDAIVFSNNQGDVTATRMGVADARQYVAAHDQVG